MKQLFCSQLKNRFIINDLIADYIIYILHSLFPIKSVCRKRTAQAKMFKKYTTAFFEAKMLTFSFNRYSKELLSSLKKYSTHPVTEKARICVYFKIYQ